MPQNDGCGLRPLAQTALQALRIVVLYAVRD